MADHIHWAALVFSTFVLFVCDCKQLDGYKFPVYTTESCPRNQTEWMERSSAINCTESNGYLCLPNENFTELLEFCYFDHRILIEKGLCMFLYKRFSIINDYSCSNFVKGCPNSTYRIYNIHKYRSCVSLGYGCFLAEPTCIRTTPTYHLSGSPGINEENKTDHKYIPFQEINHWAWILTLVGVGALISVPVIMFCYKIRNIDEETNRMKRYRKTKTNRITKCCKSGDEDIAQINKCNGEIDHSMNIASQTEGGITLKLLPNISEDDISHEIMYTPLDLACQRGNDKNVQLLLKSGANVNLCSSDGFSPLAVASLNGHESTVRLLLLKRANVDLFEKDGASPLYMASEGGHDRIAELLITNGANVNLCDSGGLSPLAAASLKGHESTVRLLLLKRADVDLFEKDGGSPLYTASQGGHDRIAELLITNGANVNLCSFKGISPLAIASENGHESTVRLLLLKRANVDLFEKDGASPLYLASQHGHDRIAELLITNGANVNLCDSRGLSPLAVASEDGHESTVRLLLLKRANVDLFEKDGASPLYMASQGGHDRIAELLITNGANVNLCDSRGFSPLVIALENGHESTFQLLLAKGADVNL